MPKQTIILTDNEVTVVLRALAICQSDMEEAYDEAKNSMVKDYYKRKAEKYSRVWNSVWNSVYTCGNKDDALWDLDKAIMIATDAIGRP